MNLRSLYNDNRNFFLAFFVFVFICILLLIAYTKTNGFYLLNFYHSNILTYFFIYVTYLGDGFFCIVIGLLLLFFKKRFLGLMVLVSYALSGLIAQVLKYFILEPRPAILLKDSGYRYFIDDVTLHNLHAFPSGHTASAFALAAALAFALSNKAYSMLLLLGAILVGYSRIYLAQHFLDDVLAGAVIGVLSAVVCQLVLQKYSQRKIFLHTNDR
ncbi:MAG: phosphatase PAP2 family protein [Ginsengibacter sp.]